VKMINTMENLVDIFTGASYKEQAYILSRFLGHIFLKQIIDV